MSPKKLLTSIAAAGICIAATTGISSAQDQPPKWWEDSQKLEQLMSNDITGEVLEPKLIQRSPSPVPGLDVLVIQGTVREAGKADRVENFVLYTDTNDRYMFFGLLIDMEVQRDVGAIYANAQITQDEDGQDVMTRPFRPQEFSYLSPVGPNYAEQALVVMIDIGPRQGVEALLQIHGLYQSMVTEGVAVRDLRIVPVTASQDERSVAGMAMALGQDRFNPGRGYSMLIEFAQSEGAPGWMAQEQLRSNNDLKEILSQGVFALENNSVQAIEARVTTLPVVFEENKGRFTQIPIPSSWRAALERR